MAAAVSTTTPDAGLKPGPVTPTLRLASRSPRRLSLLREHGFSPVVTPPGFEDPDRPEAPVGADVEAFVTDLAVRKAVSVDTPAAAVVLAADTVCVSADGTLIGKPADAHAARAMIAGFVNATHRVVTGVAIARDRRIAHAFADAATVRFGPLDADTLDAYAATHAWLGKAGGYNLAEALHAGWPVTVNGDPATVMGLPMRRLKPLLEALLATGNPAP